MAQEQVDSIIRALTNAQQLAAETNYRNGVIAQNQQELKAKQKKDEQDRADKIKQLEFENEQTKLASELAQQLGKFKILEAKQNLSTGAIIEQKPTEGFELKATFKTPDGQELETWQTPFGLLQMPSAAQRAKQQGEAKLAVEKPTLDAKTTAERETQRLKSEQDAKEAIDKEHSSFLNAQALQAQRDTAAMERAKLNNKARKEAAMLAKMTAKEEINTEPWINGLMDGTFTQEDILKAFPKDKVVAESIINNVVQAGHKPLSKDTKEFVEQLGVFKPALEDYKKLIDLTPESSNRFTGFITNSTSSAETKNLAESLNGNKLLAATVLAAQGKRTSDKDAAATVAQYLPSEAMFGIQGGTNDPKTVLVQKRARLIKAIKEGINTKLKDLSPAQKTIILDKFGLNELLTDESSSPGDKVDSLINKYKGLAK